MNNDSNQASLFAPEPTKLFAPMNVRTWSVFLSSGYIGNRFDDKTPDDFQYNSGHSVSGFLEYPEDWALKIGSDSSTVIIEIDITNLLLEKAQHFYYVNKLIRVTRANKAYFTSEMEIKNFNATFRHFKEIPIDLIPKEVTKKLIKVPSESPNITPSNKFHKFLTTDRNSKDTLCGWFNQVLQFLSSDSLSELVLEHINSCNLQVPNDKLTYRLSLSALRTVQGECEFADETIWQVSVDCILKQREQKDFDRLTLIDEINKELSDAIDRSSPPEHEREKIIKWVALVTEIFNSERDMPSFQNEEKGKLGRMAAIHSLNYFKLEQAMEVYKNNNAGSSIAMLVKFVAGAFTGFERIESPFKQNKIKLGGFLNLIEKIQLDNQINLIIGSVELDLHTKSESISYQTENQFCFEIRKEAPLFIQSLIIMSKKLGLSLQKDTISEAFYVESKLKNRIYLRKREKTEKVAETIDFYSPIVECTKKTTLKKLHEVLKLAASDSCPVIMQPINGKQFLCILLTFLPDTFDQAEFNYVVQKFDLFLKKTDQYLRC